MTGHPEICNKYMLLPLLKRLKVKERVELHHYSLSGLS
jgi:hypothetical protein